MNLKNRTKVWLCTGLLLMLPFAGAMAKDPCQNELDVYTGFLDRQCTSAKDYIIGLFGRYDIVILCERDHREITQYDLILQVIGDDYFKKNVRNACFEIGSCLNNEPLNAFLQGSDLPAEVVADSVLRFQRDAYGAALWEKANYSYYLKGVYHINRTLPEDGRVGIYNLDIGVDWKKAAEADLRQRDSLVTYQRDSMLAANFIRSFTEQTQSRKALVVLNYRHALLKDLFGRKNAGRYIKEAFPDRVANVYLNSFALKLRQGAVEIAAIQDGKWDAAFNLTGKTDLGLDLAGTPFGKDRLDIIPVESDYTFADFFTGFVYYTPFPDMRSVTGIAGFVNEAFVPELMRRYELERKVYGNTLPNPDTLKNDYNTVVDRTYRESEQFGGAIEQIEKWLE